MFPVGAEIFGIRAYAATNYSLNWEYDRKYYVGDIIVMTISVSGDGAENLTKDDFLFSQKGEGKLEDISEPGSGLTYTFRVVSSGENRRKK